jgi:tetratricopeptide (TPR) repeat protein
MANGTRARLREGGIVGPGVGLMLLVWVLLLPGPAVAQPACEEPSDPAYLSRMDQLRDAVEAGDYEAVLAHLEWAIARYDYAVLDYSRARTLHNLGRLDQAEEAYNQFLRHYEGCPDPDGLVASARSYRRLAVTERARELAAAPQPEGGDERDEGGFEPGWLLVGGGSALVVAGVIFDISKADLIDAERAAFERGDTVEFLRLDQELRDARTVDIVLYGVGVAVIGAGVAWLLLGDGGDNAQPEVEAAVGVDSAWMRWTWSF